MYPVTDWSQTHAPSCHRPSLTEPWVAKEFPPPEPYACTKIVPSSFIVITSPTFARRSKRIDAKSPGPALPVDFIQKAIVPVGELNSGSAATVICVNGTSKRIRPLCPLSEETQVAAWLVAELFEALLSTTRLFTGAAPKFKRSTSELSSTGLPANVAASSLAESIRL